MPTLIWHSKEKLSSLFVLSSANGMILPAMSSTHCFQNVFGFLQKNVE